MESLRVLVVDDSKAVRSILRNYIGNEFDADIVEAEDGEEALARAAESQFDLIFTDVEMPRLSGLDFCRHLNQVKKNAETPVIVVSTLSSEKDIEAGFEAGASAYLSKPFTQQHLRETIDDVRSRKDDVRGRVVLVVDDSSTIRNIVREGLEQEGLSVRTAGNGEEALDVLRHEHCDLILSDINMPVMDGRELHSNCRADERLASIPFLIMSANSDLETMRQLLGDGAVGYLTKPFGIDQVIATVEKCLNDHFLNVLRQKERLERERRSMLATIMGLAKALDARDEYTNLHSERVAQISVVLARHMTRSTEELELLGIAGRLHDIGKIGIPDDVLLKPGRLTDEEFNTIKGHPGIGAEILQHIPSLKKVLPIVRHHHERHDGKGYPDGLAGDEVPVLAGIMAVADVFHALASDRPYRKAMPMEKVLDILREGRDSQFSPTCIDAFLAIKDEDIEAWKEITEGSANTALQPDIPAEFAKTTA